MESWYQPFKEFYQHMKALVTAGLGKLGVETGVAENSLVAAAGASSGTVAGVILYGGFGVVSAVVNQIEYGAARGRIADFYQEELAAKLGKPKGKVRDDDIDILANGDKSKGIAANHAIAHEIAHERKIRNLGIGASFIASLAVYTLMHSFMDAVAEAVAPGASLLAPVAITGMGLAAKVIVGVLTYAAIKNPLMKAGKVLFGLNKTTTHDLIAGIAKDREHGKGITREQVVEVFISANKQLAEYVEQKYGAEYEHLPLAEKVRVSAELATILPADKIAHNINLGTANASELAFTAQGDISGVLPKVPMDKAEDPSKKSLLGRIGHKCRNMVKAINGTLHPEKAHPIATLSAINKAHSQHETGARDASPVVEMNEPNFVKDLAERRANQVHMQGTATIQ